jgi:hypothetical protein
MLLYIVARHADGHFQIYQLQTENDEEETWRDLVRPHLHLARVFMLTHHSFIVGVSLATASIDH